MTPYSRPKLSDLYTLSKSKLLEYHTLHSDTYLYSPYIAVPPPPGVYPGCQRLFYRGFRFLSSLDRKTSGYQCNKGWAMEPQAARTLNL